MTQGESRLRLQTIVRLRWLAVLGQLITVLLVHFVLDFPLRIGDCLLVIALSAWLNIFLSVRFPARYRLGTRFATAILAYDILQLAGLLYLTGGIENPFSVLIVAPVTVSAATLPLRNTVLLGVIAAAATSVIVVAYLPLPWREGYELDLPIVYKFGILAAVCSSMMFLALYGWRLAKESRQMSAALTATEVVLAREQQLHALNELAAAAAHELGTPLSTIALVVGELEREAPADGALADDLALLRSQAQRCREILQKLTARQGAADPLFGSFTVRELIEEAVAPYRELGRTIDIGVGAVAPVEGDPPGEPKGQRRPGMIYGLGNIIENAVEFSATRVGIHASWSADLVSIVISDDGPGFPPELIDTLGEPYVTKRTARPRRNGGKQSGLGLGFFIAKTLLERSGATLTLENKVPPRSGAIVRIDWRRRMFEAWMPPPGNGGAERARGPPA